MDLYNSSWVEGYEMYIDAFMVIAHHFGVRAYKLCLVAFELVL